MSGGDEVHRYIAAGMPEVSHLECMTCHKQKPLEGTAHVGEHLFCGWPKCCGYTMRLFTKREVASQKGSGR